MKYHDHYCGWKIEWEARDSGGFSFWIENEYPRVKPSTVLIDRHFVAVFRSVEAGYKETKDLIDLLYKETRLLKEITLRSFRNTPGNYQVYYPESAINQDEQ